MKVLHVYKDYPPVFGGIEGALAALAREQSARGHEVTVLVTSPDLRTTRTVESGVEVIRAGRWATVASTPISPTLPWYLRAQRVDVTHLHAPFPPGEVAQWLLGRSRATVMTYQSDVVRQRILGWLYRPVQRCAFRSVDHIMATSPPYLEPL